MKKIPFLLLEIVVVIFLVLILVFLGIDKYNDFFNHLPKYTIIFKDVDGLSVGSPVRFAGVHVGHVVKQELKKENIIVTFKITDKNLEIPKGSVAGVEFSGLGGSKSLEIKPPSPKTPNNKNFYKIEPLRINSFMEIQNEISRATLDFFNGILTFLKQNQQDAGTNLKKTAENLQEKAAKIEGIKEKIKGKGQKTIEDTKKLKTMIKETSENLTIVNNALTSLSENEEIKEKVESVKTSTVKLSEFIESEKMQELNQNVKKINGKVTALKDRELGYINEFNESLKAANSKLQKLIESLKNREENNPPDL